MIWGSTCLTAVHRMQYTCAPLVGSVCLQVLVPLGHFISFGINLSIGKVFKCVPFTKRVDSILYNSCFVVISVHVM